MALRVFLGAGLIGSQLGALLPSWAGWKYLDGGVGGNLDLRRQMNNTMLDGQLRHNNDGPGWTRNRTTTTPDLYRPIPFKEVVQGTTQVAHAGAIGI